MRTLLITLFLTLLFSLEPVEARAAVQKIATINLKKVYSEYWKTKKADEAIKRKALDKQKIAEGIEKDLRSLDDQIRKSEKCRHWPKSRQCS